MRWSILVVEGKRTDLIYAHTTGPFGTSGHWKNGLDFPLNLRAYVEKKKRNGKKVNRCQYWHHLL